MHRVCWFLPSTIGPMMHKTFGLPALEAEGVAPSSVREVFDKMLPDLEFDQELAKRIHRYVQEFINRNKDHAAFFGGVLLGVEVVRFLDSDKDRWFDEIIGSDELMLQDMLYSLPTINRDWKVSSNVMNLSCVWMVHRFFNSSLPAKEKMDAMIDVLLVLQIKYTTSILFRFFQYPADRAVAEATYAALNLKFILKETGSWLALLTYRAKEMLSRTSPHLSVFSRMDKDKGVVDMLNAAHGAIKSYIKNMRGVMEHIRLTGGKIKTTSSVAGVDGDEILKDRTKGPATLINYIKSILSDRNSFIRDDLLRVVIDLMPSVQYRYLVSSLEFLSANYFKAHHKDIDRIINLAMLHSYSYLSGSNAVARPSMNLATVVSRLRGAYTSSRSTDPDLLELRELVEKVIRPAVDSKTAAVLAATRTGVLLYIVARANAMSYYSGGA